MKDKKYLYYLAMIITFFLGVAGTVLLVQNVSLSNTKIINETVKTVNVTEADSLKSAIEKVYNSVVYIETVTNKGNGSGSGFVYKTDDKYGYILTNFHVIDGNKSIKVTNASMLAYDAIVLGSDAASDLAVLRVSKDAVMLVAELGESSAMSIGDTVFAVGSPQGITYINSVTRGIISGSNRLVPVTINNMEYMMDVLQTDTAINPGNSGGPLVSSTGKVIGINSMKLVESKIEGMGFAIPIEVALSYVGKLENGESILRPYLGVSTLNVTAYKNNYNKAYYERYYNFTFTIADSINTGVVITTMEDDSVAKKAGLQVGDVVIKMDNTDIDDSTHFRYILYKYQIGDTIKVKFYRGTELKEVSVLLSSIKKD